MASLSLQKASMPAIGGFSFHNTARNAQLESGGAQKGLCRPAEDGHHHRWRGVQGWYRWGQTPCHEGMVVADKNCSKIISSLPTSSKSAWSRIKRCLLLLLWGERLQTPNDHPDDLFKHGASPFDRPASKSCDGQPDAEADAFQGYIGAALVLGGVDVTGFHLYSIYPHGSTDKLPYVTMERGPAPRSPTPSPQPAKMASLSLQKASMPAIGGFSFHNTARNAQLESGGAQKGLRLPAARKTGTTIAGVVYKDGIVLGADTRATEGMVVADKNCSKIHFIAPNIYCCGAGTAADTEMTTQMISSNMELHSLSTGRLPRVVTANRMLKQMLFSIYPHGSTDKLPYVTMGSGSLAAMAVFEAKFKPDMEHCRLGRYQCEKGTTGILSEKVIRLELEVAEETVQTMDTS
ncbi:putative Proteasome subunit beta type protein [Naja naja]|nr:putative Proteasome subunit beta type protein [Naja naja]